MIPDEAVEAAAEALTCVDRKSWALITRETRESILGDARRGQAMTDIEKAQVILNLHSIQRREMGDIIGPYCAECTSPIDGGPELYPCLTVKAVLDTLGGGVSSGL